MISFNYPWLFVLLPLPLAVYFLLPALKKSSAALFIPLLSQYPIHVQSTQTSPTKKTALVLLVLAWFSLLTAACQPMWLGKPINIDHSGRDVFLAVDISGSMQITDMQFHGQTVDRLSMVKRVLGEFIAQRQGDRLGLILFASKAYVQAPLTLDLSTIKQLLNEAMIGFAGQQTAIGDAIALAVKRLNDNPAEQRTLILLTDGANNAGQFDPIEAAKRARDANVRIYTVAFGSDKQKPGGFFGMSTGSYSDDMDEKSLQTIANITHGQYFRARDPEQLKHIYDTINKLEKHTLDKNLYRPRQSLFYWPLALAMLLFITCLLLQQKQGANNG